jgi:urease gamma subunit
LSQYDSENLSEADAQAIVEAFQAEGIQPGRALAEAMNAEGFDAREVGQLAGVEGPRGGGGMPPPPPPPSDEEVSSISSLLDTLLNSDEEDEESTTTTSGINSDSTFDEVMEYTSRILSLNSKSQESVLEMLTKLSTNENDYSKSEMNNLVKGSLSSILSDTNNYNQTSFYA